MKLNNEEVKKLCLGAMMVVGVVVGYYLLLLGPLTDKQAATTAAINALEPKIKSGQDQILRTKRLEESAPAATLIYKQLTSLISTSSPVVWFPPRITDFFQKSGIDDVAVRPMGNPIAADQFKGFALQTWTVDIPACSFAALAKTLPVMENEEILAQIKTLNIDVVAATPEMLKVSMLAVNIVRE